MMSFCKNTLHAFLPISLPNNEHHCPSTTAAGLISITGDSPKSATILLSASLKVKTAAKKDPAGSSGSGSLDELRGGGGSSVNGLSSCTESLGLESSEQMEETIDETVMSKSTITAPVKSRGRLRCREEAKKFPPALSSLKRNHGDYSTSFLKPVREHGRLILIKVTINRPEIFRASRQDGRLRLLLVKQDEVLEKSSEESEDEKEESLVESKRISLEGLRRCHDLHRNHHHLHHLQQIWNQQCVTSQ